MDLEYKIAYKVKLNCICYRLKNRCTNNFSLISDFSLFVGRSCELLLLLFVCLMVFNATFNIISVISWRSVPLAEETGGPGKNH